MVNEKKTDFFIGKLLNDAKIQFEPNGSHIKEIKEALKTASKRGTHKSGFPDFVGMSDEFIIVIEDKPEIKKQALYIGEKQEELDLKVEAIKNYAENGALHYAQHIIKKTNFKKVFAFGCSGDEKHHIIRPIFVSPDNYKMLDPVENFENFNEENIKQYYKEQILHQISEEEEELITLCQRAEDLHKDLRIYGQLGETEKPLVVSAILLALDDKENEDLIETLKGKDTKTDGKLLFEALEISLKNSKISSEKREIILNQFTLIKDRKILSKKHKDLGKTPLKYFTEFIKEKIYDKIKNFKSPADVLGNFYGEFMRYSGGDGKSLGIVLTPHHITELFCELAELNINDIVFDPCCGTGGFLISAMHSLITKANNKKEIEHIKLNQIHGIEIREDMFSIATTNMILRGDGKSNLIRNDFLDMNSDKFIDKKFTVGFLNPPYALREGKNTAHLSEIHFVEHLLDSLTEKGRGVVIVPTSAMTGKYKEDAEAKKRILKKHTLEGVITLNTNTFYRIGVNACIAVFTSHVPHDSNKYCKFINFKNDGYEIHKNIGLIKTERAKEKKKHLLDCWLRDSPSDNNYMVKSKIKDSDDWLHSFYYFNDDIPSKASFEKTMLNYLRFEFNLILNDKLKNNPKENINIHDCCDFKDIKWKEFRIEDIFTISGTKTTHVSELMNKNDYDNEFPYITTKSKNNGVDGFYNYFTEKGNVITVDSATDGNIFYQEMNFSASDHVEKLTPKFKMNRYSALFIVSSLSFSTKNKYDYGYKFSQHRLKRQTLLLPVKNKNIDYTFMENYMHNLEYTFLNKYFKFFNKEI